MARKKAAKVYRLLIIEDVFSLKESIKECFASVEDNEYKVDFSDSFTEGLNKIRSRHYDLIIIDVRLAQTACEDFCRSFREYCVSPAVFILDINNEEEMKCVYSMSPAGLIVRPFTALDVFESVVDYFDRCKIRKADQMLKYCGIMMNASTGLVMVDGIPAEVTKKASQVLKILLKNKAKLVSREKLIKEVWGSDYQGSDRVLDNQIKILRKQLGSKGKLIRLVKGKGYVLER